MLSSTRALVQLTIEQRRKLLCFPTITALLTESWLLIQGVNDSSTVAMRQIILVAGVFSIVYTLLLITVLYPWSLRHPRMNWGIAALNAFGVAVLNLLTPSPNGTAVILLSLVVVLFFAVHSARGPAYLFIGVLTGLVIGTTAFWNARAGLPWQGILALPLLSSMVLETTFHLRSALIDQIGRLEALNQVSRTITSTIEPAQMISLVSATLQNVVHADSYFVGLVREGRLHLELFYDDGEFFPPKEIDVREGIAGWVLANRRSLLLTDLPGQMGELGLQPIQIGKEKHSLSWMGAPLEAGGQLLGIIAVASYQHRAFRPADLVLIENVAQQTGLALMNAFHHAEVERQSRLDSLTGTYNHRHFLHLLEENAEIARLNRSPLSLIMLDVDGFKDYNDRYGHLTGDQVLIQLTETIRSHLRSTDVLGRWGGEEFILFTMDTPGRAAAAIALRIRNSLREQTLTTMDGLEIPLPTISQGVAVLPDEAQQVETLIHLADQRLYRAKARGRNQIDPRPIYWLKHAPFKVLESSPN